MMEGAQNTERTEGFENPMDSGATSKKPSEASDVPSLRFCVNQVNLDPNQGAENTDDLTPRMNFPDAQSPNRLSVHDATNTIGYATHDAVPMTVFYRNENSNPNVTKKSRPTLQELRKGFEEDHEQQVSFLDLLPVYNILLSEYFFCADCHAFPNLIDRLAYAMAVFSARKGFEVKLLFISLLWYFL